MEKNYVQAVIKLLLGGQDVDVTLKSLLKVLEHKGHSKLYHRILLSLRREFAAAQKPYIPQVTVANSNQVQTLQTSIEKHLKMLNAPSDYQLTTDNNQIGGVKTKYKHQQIDSSYQSQLLKIYQRLLIS